ncbi:hypothetical protein JD292_06200 [Leucobacter sp. CSA2]|uniref:Transglutaminase-like domain-containing protein n=1 Tax=Leucobacter edaphi TaxID=2796472 RepID=A0A934QE89_9MICO|nr:transglutaminase domain-containing protein [Leucobacter edaphi]MBK0421662.1 hypothetical protein [Leucobacter edaphi]
MTVGAGVLALGIGVFAALSSAPIYADARAWVVSLVGAGLAFGVVWLGRRFRWGPLTLVALIGIFVATLVPVAVPGAFASGPEGIVRGFGDGLAAVALGWKQLLTLTLPVGTYQSVLVPLYVIAFGATAISSWLALRAGRFAEWAALPLVLPVAFGTAFGSSNLSDPLRLGALRIIAPRELAIWILAFAGIAIWIAWSSGIDRRAALRRGRAGMDRAPVRRRGAQRGIIGAAVVVLALAIASFAAPAIAGPERSVARDRIDPELVIAERTSPLAGYREWKRDANFGADLFEVRANGALPGRVHLAVMDRYDGVDFSVGTGGSSERFTRFPSGEAVSMSSRVTVRIAGGYSDIWVPVSTPLASPPQFGGPRASALADAFYLNRDTGGAVAVPTKRGLVNGDSFSADMSIAGDRTLAEDPANPESQIDLEKMPELAKWWKAQGLSPTGSGLAEGIKRLRDRGYLSHSLTEGPGEQQWLAALQKDYGTRFVTSTGGHSIARVEQLFKQLNDQQHAAGPKADDRMLVAGIGDDEQFAAAAALLAQSLGFDSRVALGVRLGGDGVPGVPACAESCTGENMAAWIEVRGADGVWAPFDVTPQVEIPPTSLEEGEQLPEYPTVPEERDAQESDPPIGTSDADGKPANSTKPEGEAIFWQVLKYAGLGLGALAILAALSLFIPLAKRFRRNRRRSAPSPEIRAIGAWDQLLDAHRDAGRSVDSGVARRIAAADLGIEDADWIAREVDRAVFSREGIDAPAADALWRRVDTAERELRAGLSPWGRIRARFSLASYRSGRASRRRRFVSRGPGKPNQTKGTSG